MSHRINTEDEANRGAHTAAGRPTVWDDEPWLDHHVEEVLGALSAVASLQASPDASA